MSAAASAGLNRDVTAHHEPLRFSDVISELHRIADMAGHLDEAGGSEIAAACHRAESLLTRLRNQFLEDLLGDEGAPAVSVA